MITNEIKQSFHARVLFLCEGVLSANTLTDIMVLKDRARMIEREITGRQPVAATVDDGSDLI